MSNVFGIDQSEMQQCDVSCCCILSLDQLRQFVGSRSSYSRQQLLASSRFPLVDDRGLGVAVSRHKRPCSSFQKFGSVFKALSSLLIETRKRLRFLCAAFPASCKRKDTIDHHNQCLCFERRVATAYSFHYRSSQWAKQSYIHNQRERGYRYIIVLHNFY